MSSRSVRMARLGSISSPFRMQASNRVEVELTKDGFSVSINQSPVRSFSSSVLRKICFGGLCEAPEWPMGMQSGKAVGDVRLKLILITVEKRVPSTRLRKLPSR